MIGRAKITFSLLGLLLILTAACGKIQKAPPPTLTQADQKFSKICKEELKYDVIVHPVRQTLWIYCPLKENIFNVKASHEPAKNTKEPTVGPSVRYIDGRFEKGDFIIEYDIAKSKTYPKDAGYASTYSEEAQKRQQNILAAIQRAYFELEPDPATSKLPIQFIVLDIADTINGIEIENTFYFEDLKRTMGLVASMPQEEYSQRIISEVRGNMNIISDAEGSHLNYRDIAFEDFLAKQMVNRINFKFTRSNFPPSDDVITELKDIIATSIQSYDFKNFTAAKLVDLDTSTTKMLEKEELLNYKPRESPPQGKLHIIKFF